jgi:hypothetical protein
MPITFGHVALGMSMALLGLFSLDPSSMPITGRGNERQDGSRASAYR